MIDTQTIPMADFRLFDSDCGQDSVLSLDSQAIQSLQLIEVEGFCKNQTKGSLFDFLDRCKTCFGKRLLKKWICSPLSRIEDIQNRLDAVEDLIGCPDAVRQFQNRSWKLPDLEKSLSLIYQFSASSYHQNRVTFENIPAIKLKEFFQILDHFKSIKTTITNFHQFHQAFKSQRLKALTSVQKTSTLNSEDATALFPNIDREIAGFEALVSWLPTKNGDMIPEPVKGCDSNYDLAK